MKLRTVIVAGMSGAVVSGSIVAFAAGPALQGADAENGRYAQGLLDEGKKIFRYETFGSEAFWGDTLQLHKAIAGEKNGGVGPGVSPKTAPQLIEAVKRGVMLAGGLPMDFPTISIHESFSSPTTKRASMRPSASVFSLLRQRS